MLSIVRTIGSKNPRSSQLFGERFVVRLSSVCSRSKKTPEKMQRYKTLFANTKSVKISSDKGLKRQGLKR